MTNPFVIVLLTILGLVVLKFAVLIVLGCSLGRLGLGVKAALGVMRDEELAKKVEPLLAPKQDDKPSGEPLRILNVLQRDSRLIDFLLEDLQGAEDTDIGAAVREIQVKAQASLKKHLVIEPVMKEEEETTVEVPKGFDPSQIQVTGNVAGEPPFKGTLKHAGWHVKEIHVTPPPEGQDEFVMQPAEVEIE